MKRVAEIDARLAKIQKDGAVIKKHCTATDAEIRAEVPKYRKALDDAEARTEVFDQRWARRASYETPRRPVDKKAEDCRHVVDKACRNAGARRTIGSHESLNAAYFQQF